MAFGQASKRSVSKLSTPDLNFIVRRQTIIASTNNQTVFTLSVPYSTGMNSMSVYINGVRQYPNTYTETNNLTVTLSVGVPVGTVLFFETGIVTSGNASDSILSTFTPASDITATTVQDAILAVNSKHRRSLALAAASF